MFQVKNETFQMKMEIMSIKFWRRSQDCARDQDRDQSMPNQDRDQSIPKQDQDRAFQTKTQTRLRKKEGKFFF